MKKESLATKTASQKAAEIPCHIVHTLVIGSGTAGLNAAVQVRRNDIEDVMIISEGLQMGTSINTGSDKQTYYKLGLWGNEADSPDSVAQALYAGGGMHGDLALVEGSLSARAFMNLVNLGVPFPRDVFGQFVGYKTDHDPRQRATSVGPYTSKAMCRYLIREVERLGIPVLENRLAVSLLTVTDGENRRIGGAMVLNCQNSHQPSADWLSNFEIYVAENVILAVGGPGGLYKTSVYPAVHTGAIGLALMIGAQAQNLSESQYGLASIKFRWNVSGTYMQVMPRFISTTRDGCSDEREFLRDYFESPGALNSAVFLKGYQWPFDCSKIIQGSSLIDVLVYIETVVKDRRVFLDFRSDPQDFGFESLSAEACDYLARSKALVPKPIVRLRAINPDAVALYADHQIDIATEPLEIAVCAQHNNGGLAANIWWESTNIRHLFPVGEVNGSHGVARPGGSALNAGQVGGIRAAEFIANRYAQLTLDVEEAKAQAAVQAEQLARWISAAQEASKTWQAHQGEFQERMTRAGAHIRSLPNLKKAVAEARRQWRRLAQNGCGFNGLEGLCEALNTRQLCYAHMVYLEALLFAVQSGVGSRGSAMVLDPAGVLPHPNLSREWRFLPENTDFRNKVLTTRVDASGQVISRWEDRRALPQTAAWFETAWAAFKKGEIYG